MYVFKDLLQRRTIRIPPHVRRHATASFQDTIRTNVLIKNQEGNLTSKPLAILCMLFANIWDKCVYTLHYHLAEYTSSTHTHYLHPASPKASYSVSHHSCSYPITHTLVPPPNPNVADYCYQDPSHPTANPAVVLSLEEKFLHRDVTKISDQLWWLHQCGCCPSTQGSPGLSANILTSPVSGLW